MRRRRNPQRPFTADEIWTAALLVAEGTATCTSSTRRIGKIRYREWYPAIQIKMCDRKALEPAERVFFPAKIRKSKTKKIICPPHLFPPDGKGRWVLQKQHTKHKKL